MPNWCFNTLKIEGPFKGEVANFIHPIDFNIIPEPDKDMTHKERWEWRLRNWHTRSNAQNVSKRYNIIHFETAWGPPEPIIKKYSMMFEDCTFTLEYEEPNLGFSGVIVYRNNQKIIEKEIDPNA